RHYLDAREILGPLLEVEGQGAGNVLLDLERGQGIAAVTPDHCADLQGGNLDESRERTDLAEAEVPPLREVGDLDLHRQPGDVRDQLLSVAVEDWPSRSLDAHVAKLVVLRGAQQLLAVQDLQRPEPEEEGRE